MELKTEVIDGAQEIDIKFAGVTAVNQGAFIVDMSQVDLANEAVANAISYGYPAGVRGEIALRLGTADGNAVLEIEDDGIAFNPLQLAEPSPPRSLEESRIGGLGVPLIRKSMACEYQRRAGRNLLILKSPLASS